MSEWLLSLHFYILLCISLNWLHLLITSKATLQRRVNTACLNLISILSLGLLAKLALGWCPGTWISRGLHDTLTDKGDPQDPNCLHNVAYAEHLLSFRESWILIPDRRCLCNPPPMKNWALNLQEASLKTICHTCCMSHCKRNHACSGWFHWDGLLRVCTWIPLHWLLHLIPALIRFCIPSL